MRRTVPAGPGSAAPSSCCGRCADALEDLYGDPRTIWRDRATDVRGHGMDAGHHVAEEAPEPLSAALGGFFTD